MCFVYLQDIIRIIQKHTDVFLLNMIKINVIILNNK